MGARAGLILLLLLAGCAPRPTGPWATICREAPYHGGDRLPGDVLAALDTLPSFPSMTDVNGRCAE